MITEVWQAVGGRRFLLALLAFAVYAGIFVVLLRVLTAFPRDQDL